MAKQLAKMNKAKKQIAFLIWKSKFALLQLW